MENMTTEEDLERYLRKILAHQRYLAVIDDVWHTEAWESLKRALPDNKNGSRVIITTRNKFIAECLDVRTYSHKLRFLNREESWELFCKKMYPGRSIVNGEDNNMKIEKDMVEKCGGLPLAIIVLARLLSPKSALERRIIRKHIWRNLKENDPINIKFILTLSFKDLPFYLKPCFLYVGLYPEDRMIATESLCRKWVAEGFIKPRFDEDETLEETAEDYLHQLIDRSLIQVAKRRASRVTQCRVHDLLRDLAIEKARDLNFLHIFNGSLELSFQLDALESSRRHTLHGDGDTEAESLYDLLEWEVEEGAMPMLRGLRVDYCNNLREIPQSLQSVPVAPLSEFVWDEYDD
ncbi:NB-ARC [Dillenia turbinata]|uniref:NB-ARC n=1 Tax=Dillenia turbinata TaxID=194707 RepID=A0AAN8UPI1_9MAGN